jgi:hypothetical protein
MPDLFTRGGMCARWEVEAEVENQFIGSEMMTMLAALTDS